MQYGERPRPSFIKRVLRLFASPVIHRLMDFPFLLRVQLRRCAAILGPLLLSQPLPLIPVFNRSTPDPARMALARSVTAKLLPPGYQRKLMEDPFNLAMAGLDHQLIMRPVNDFAAEVGIDLPVEGMDGPPLVKLQILGILDPARQQRSRARWRLLRQAVIEVATRAEPHMREALATAYAVRLNAEQLQELDRFLGTPSGAAYASAALSVQFDPEVEGAAQTLNRSISDALPGIVKRLDAATASLPKPKTARDLTDDERARIAALLHADPAKLKARPAKIRR
jgi:hypothetical protein